MKVNFMEKLALRIAKSIRNNYEQSGSEEALTYSLLLLINTFLALVITLIISFFTGHVWPALLVFLSFFIIRTITGGVHLSTPISCCIFSSVLLTSLAHVNFEYGSIGYILDSLSILIFALLAPYGSEKINTMDPKHYPKLKCLSILLVASNFFIHSHLLTAVFFVQALTLTKYAYWLIETIERRLGSYETSRS